MNFSKARKILARHDRILILMHSSPDMDCIGAAYALILYLRSTGKEAVAAIESPLPARYTFLISEDHLKQYFLPKDQILSSNFNLTVCVDTSDPRLLGEFEPLIIKNPVLVLDHHATFIPYGTWNFNRPEASSTCEMIFDLCQSRLTPLTASALYAGMVYDTGNFRYAVRPELFLKAARILKKISIDTELIYFNLFENESLSRKRLESRIIASLQTHAGGEMAVSFLRESFKTGLVLTESDTADLVRVGHSLQGCRFSVFIKEKEDGVSLSLRSRNDFDVSELASKFGGGGHRKASGIKLKGFDCARVEAEVLPKMIESYENWRKNHEA